MLKMFWDFEKSLKKGKNLGKFWLKLKKVNFSFLVSHFSPRNEKLKKTREREFLVLGPTHSYLLFSLGCSCLFGSNQYKWTWVTLKCGLLMLFWVKPVQMDMGCSSAWVSEAILVKNNSKRTWVALQCGLLILFWVQPVQILYGLLFSVGYSCLFG